MTKGILYFVIVHFLLIMLVFSILKTVITCPGNPPSVKLFIINHSDRNEMKKLKIVYMNSSMKREISCWLLIIWLHIISKKRLLILI